MNKMSHQSSRSRNNQLHPNDIVSQDDGDYLRESGMVELKSTRMRQTSDGGSDSQNQMIIVDDSRRNRDEDTIRN